MSFSRRLLLALPLAALTGLHSACAADPNPAVVVVEHFYDGLLVVMKQAKRLSFDERYNRLAPMIERTLDLGLMTRLAVGPGWVQLPADQQQRLNAAFAGYTISTYANRFNSYDGERFEVSPNVTSSSNGLIVNSRIVEADGKKTTLDFLMRQDSAGSWKIIDVYLSGTVSELAARRSEFIAVLQREGADGLVQMLQRRTAALRAG